MTSATANPILPLISTTGSILIKHGHVVDPGQGLDSQRDILIEDGRIRAIESQISPGSVGSIIDAQGLTVIPGLVDLHCHLREPGGGNSETIETGTRAAAAGGFTTVCTMPGTQPVCDSPVAVRYVIDRARQTGSVRVLPIAAITKGQEGQQLTELAGLKAAGAVGVGDAMHCVADAQVLRRAMQYAHNLQLPIFDHAEDPELAAGGQMHEGEVSLKLGLHGIPRSAESSVVARDAQLALETGAHVHFCHISNSESVEILRFYKARNARITADVTPHHLTLTHYVIAGSGQKGEARYDTNMKVKPPLCAEEDRAALIEALEDGTIDCIATDHAPHFPASKDTLFDMAPFGIIGLESALPLLLTTFVHTQQWTLSDLVRRLSVSPAGVLGAPMGTLLAGTSADLAIIDLDTNYEFDDSCLRSKSRNCPWLGQTMTGRVAGTICRGREVHAHMGTFPHGLFGKRST